MTCGFQVEVDKGCQRGLHLRYRTSQELRPDLSPGLQARFDDTVSAVEALGARSVHRVVVPFRFEVRWGQRDSELSLLLRFSSPEEERRADRQRFEAFLSEYLSLGATL
jgi:hypothetical protein